MSNLYKSQIEYANTFIPWGSSTCSKAPTMEPYDPAAIDHGKGCRVWDIEGREFIDFRNGLGPVTLGYAYPEVNAAVAEQMEKGIVFGHPSHLEAKLAELICQVIPCAEMVRFLKTGGEAVAAAMRIARGYTGKDHIIQVGYNGWLNSLAAGGSVLPGQVGMSPKSGVPACLSALHHAAPWNDVEGITKIFDDCNNNVAAIVIASAYDNVEAGKNFYPAMRKLADERGALLIFDEIVTGFRIALGGAQEYFGVTPDMAVFSKGIANGYPISVFCGKRDVMMQCAPGGGCVISSTFSGDAMSLTAAITTINIYRRENVVAHLTKLGSILYDALGELFGKYNLPLRVCGYRAFPAYRPKDASAPAGVASKFMKYCFKHGVSTYTVFYINYSHTEADIEEAIAKIELACKDLAEELNQ